MARMTMIRRRSSRMPMVEPLRIVDGSVPSAEADVLLCPAASCAMPSSQNPYELLPACQTVVDRRRVGRFDVCLVRPAAAEALLAAAVDEAPYWAELWPAASALAEVVAR